MTAAKPNVTVRFFTSFRVLTGVKETQVAATDIKEMIDLLVARFGDKFRQLLLDQDGSIKPHFHVLVNGRHVRLLNGVHTLLNDGDKVAIFPPIGGG